ncbi:hypothetical protein ADK52_36915 [Streptomyces sp. WM6372]|uniref:hypothetical protein n=1 Tax=Streptomyces sp. WM6372 TaxID=1415555 RepID=UPI0006ADEDEE|nr:hypothetical protein [Streptomyces sp. WM6372]KOU14208.1 hypothetical protein ADK52_36915 [Streptomyces sp. WM6372]
MSKIYGVLAGSAVAGAVTGWMARVLWLWSIAEGERSCADSVALCFSLFPFAGIGLWVVLAVPVLLLALWLLDVRPLKAMVTASFALQWFIIVVLAGLSRRDLPESMALNVGAMAVGPVLVALCADPVRRRAGLVAVGVLVTVSLFLVWFSIHVSGYFL